MQQPSFSQSSTRAVLDKGTEDESSIVGYRTNLLKSILAHLFALLLAGLPYLLAKWKPRWRLSVTSSVCQLWRAESLLITHKESRDVYIVRVEVEEVSSGFPARFIAPPEPLSTRDTAKLLVDRPSSFRYVSYRHLRYGWDNEGCCFTRIVGLDRGTQISDLHQKYKDGVSRVRAPSLLQLHGENSINVRIPTYVSLFVDEVLHPFYIFQLCSIVLWFADEYTYYAVCIIIISVISILVSLFETRRQAESLHDMVCAGGELTCCVRRGEDVEEVELGQLVPGDLLVVPRAGCMMSCDAVLLTGAAIVNEAMLTGESVPVTKSAVHRLEEDEMYHPENHNRHTLFAGTQVIQTRFYGNHEVLAVVVRTGFQTSKGQLIRSILFPRPLDFKFYQDTIKFILALFAVASVGMAYSIYLYVLRGASVAVILIRTLDIITIVVPPALPAAMTVGTIYAQSRLKKKGIFCISPGRINIAGKLKLICFDKTGTLTEDGLDLKGVIPSVGSSLKSLVEDLTSLSEESMLLWSLASCHSLTTINEVLTGDPLDAKMFQGTGWILEDHGEDETRFDQIMPTVVKPHRSSVFSLESLPLEIGIIRQFTFSSALARMSVIVRELSGPNFVVFTKGAPEKMEEICTPASIPADFHTKLTELTLQGYRVIALAHKPFDRSINWIKVQKMKREDVEKDLEFLGFLVMQNTLKPETEGVIRELKTAELKIVMITGDNLLTGISVSRDCGIVDPGDRVVVIDVIHRDENLCLKFHDAEGSFNDDISSVLVKEDILPRQLYQSVQVERKTHLAVSGKSWSALIKHFPELVPRVLVQGTVFARMSPDQKAHLVEELQSLGYIAAMCGDGANDCGALKAAHVGVSLSEAEASVAAPFTSRIPNISCMPALILEGRCSLVTSFAVFKYMALYSMIQFISVLILYTNKTNLGDKMFLYIDLVITTTVAVLMGRTGPWNTLVRKRPQGSLMAGQTILSIFCQILASLAGQLVGIFYLQSQTWYTPVDPEDGSEEVVVDASVTSIFLISSFQYLVVATVYSTGPPYRKPFYTNLLYLLSLVLLSVCTIYFLFIPSIPFPIIQTFMEMQPLFYEFKLGVLAIILVNAGVNVILELLVSSGSWVKRLSHCLTRKRAPKNKYKMVLRELAEDITWPLNGQIYTSGGPLR